MNETYEVVGKPWWLSKGVWGPIIAIASMSASAAGSQLDVSAIILHGLELVTVIGIGLGWWGRVEAKEPIDKTRILPPLK